MHTKKNHVLGVGEAAPSRLELMTLKNLPNANLEEPSGPCYRVTLTNYGKKLVEVTATKQTEPMPRRKRPPAERGKKERSALDPEHLLRAAIRAKKLVRQKTIMMGADRMLTLTYKENMQELDLGWQHFKAFIRGCRKYYGEFPYIVVPEYQKRGAVHFHLALNKYYSVVVLRAIWKKAINGEGNVDITSPRKGGQWNRQKISRYISKYITKGLEDGIANKRRYATSKNITMPEKVTVYLPISQNIGIYISRLLSAFNPGGPKRWFEASDTRPIIWAATF